MSLSSILQQKGHSDTQLQSLKLYAEQHINYFHSIIKTKGQSHKSNTAKDLQHQNKILVFQLKLYKKAFQLGCSDLSTIDKAKLSLQNQALSKNNQSLKAQLTFLAKENTSLSKQNKSYEQQNNALVNRNKQLQKSCANAQKIISQMNKLGGKTKYNSMLDQINSLKRQNAKLSQQHQKLKQKFSLQLKKCKILTDLNKQTEEKLAQIMVQKKSQDSSNLQNKVDCQNVRKRGKSNIQLPNKKLLIESLAAKQEMRKMRKVIDTLEHEKQQQKQTFEQRQRIYSKMIIR